MCSIKVWAGFLGLLLITPAGTPPATTLDDTVAGIVRESVNPGNLIQNIHPAIFFPIVCADDALIQKKE